MRYKKIFFVGIKGVGMAPLAILAKQAGFVVKGSDVDEEFITDPALKKEGITPLVGFFEKSVAEFLGTSKREEVLLIATGAHGGFSNPQVKYAQGQGIKVLSYGEALGIFMSGDLFSRRDTFGISVAGSHGKTTISAMLATYFTKLGFDPSYVVGTGEVFPIGAPGHSGKGKYFISEADEYKSVPEFDDTPKFFYQAPYVSAAILNNIDFDHPDQFKDIDAVDQAFWEFASNIRARAVLVMNGDDTRLRKIGTRLKDSHTVLFYGTSQENDFYISHYYQSDEKSFFKVERSGMFLGEFSLSIPGYHNAKNSLSVLALLSELGVSIQKIAEVFPTFLGTKRRFEKVGSTASGALLFDDYAHHPQEIKATLSSLRARFPKKKIVCIFQAHTYSRTKALLSEFVSAFSDANTLILLPTFSSAREEAPSEELEQEVVNKFRSINKNVLFFKDASHVVEYVDETFGGKEYVIMTMGAGDVYKISSKLKALASIRRSGQNSKL